VTCESITTTARLRKPPASAARLHSAALRTAARATRLLLRSHYGRCAPYVSSLRAAGSLALRHFGRCAPYASFVSTLLAASCGPHPAAFGIAYATLRRPLRGRATAVWLRPLRAFLTALRVQKKATAVARPLRAGVGRASPPPGLFRKIKKSASPTASLFFHFFEKTRRLPQFGYQKARRCGLFIGA